MTVETNGSAVEFTLFDRPRHLQFGYDQYIELETRSGRTPLQFVTNLLQLSATDLRTALWIGLKWEDKRVVTLEWVGTQVQKHLRKGNGIVDLIKALDAAFAASGYFATSDAAADDEASGLPLLRAVPTGGASADSPTTRSEG